MSKNSTVNKSDFVTALVIFLVSLGALIQSFNMPTYGKGLKAILSHPGLTPAVVSIGLLIMSTVLLVQNYSSIKSIKGLLVKKEHHKTPSIEKLRVLIVFAVIVVYAILLPLLRYAKASFITLFVFQFIFIKRYNLKSILTILSVSLAVTYILNWLFTNFFTIPLP